MTIWGWVGIAAGVTVGLSVVVGLVIGRVLSSIGTRITQIVEAEAWMSAPLTRAIKPPLDELSSRRERQKTRGSKTRS